MKRKQLKMTKGFRVAVGNTRAQAAEMVIAPTDAEGSPTNRHDGADQYLYVVAGAGRATINGRKIPLQAGTLLLIEHGDRHEIRNVGRTLLRTLNFYTPPAYDKKGNPLPPAEPEDKVARRSRE
jgi:mannose-6-phosphate isomerase-like protein (cupin superfamily)